MKFRPTLLAFGLGAIAIATSIGAQAEGNVENGKKLAYIAMGCNDAGFVDNAMLESEVDAGFFGSRVGEKDLTGAIASVTSYRTAQAVFAPVGAAKGLSKVFDAGSVPNPAFVQMSQVPDAVSDKVAAAVIGYGGSGAISSWARPTTSRPKFSPTSQRPPARTCSP